MGIQGLLPQLKSIMQPIHMKELKGSCVAVDTYSWLHKGALSCSKELCKGLPTTRHIEYCMHRVNLLRHYGIKPILVFDGGFLPMKIEQENKRARSRKEHLARAIEHESNGNSSASYDCYQKAVDISPSIAYDLIQVLRKEDVHYVVAPYEADAQMTFLAITKQVDAVITEDSDLIPFGCPRIIYKMDKYGQGMEFQSSNLPKNMDLSFTGFSSQMIIEMCILSGCDYLQSLPGLGLKKAHALMKKFRKYENVIKHLRYNTAAVPPNYEEMFRKAILTFRHQLVYDPIRELIVHLHDVPDHVDDDLEFLGPPIPQHIAKGIAKGDMDPITKLPIQGGSLNFVQTIGKADQPKAIKPEVRKKLELPAQKNLLTKYFCFASLETKKQFKAPRLSTDNSSPASNSSPSSNSMDSPCINIPADDDSAWELNINNSSDDSPGHKHVHNDFSIEEDEKAEPAPFENTRAVTEIKMPKSSLIELSTSAIHKPCTSIQNEFHGRPSHGTNVIMGKENGKVVVRSRYFQHKAGKENREEPEDEIFQAQKEALTKRKTCFHDATQQDNMNPKRPNVSHMDSSLQSTEISSLAHDKFNLEKETEDKFGLNISHLDRYSDIAEQSIERFVSVISSYRYKGSGSRASGLRAPLKAVRNRTNGGIDISQFAYVPKDRKAGL